MENKKITFAENTAISTLVNVYIRETGNGHRYYTKPQYDPAIAGLFEETSIDKWMKIPIESLDQELFCPLKLYSETGRHDYESPVYIRDNKTDGIRVLDLRSLAMVLYGDLKEKENVTLSLEDFLDRVEDSKNNISKFIELRKDKLDNLEEVSLPLLDFIQSEQSLLLGHLMHPFGKGRKGWTEEELFRYSPESQQEFQLHYYLAAPAVVEETESYKKVSEALKANLLKDKNTRTEVLDLLSQYVGFTLLPLHPWESQYLLSKGELGSLLESNKLIELGACGEAYQATSSVRTVYSKDQEYMFKFSLHVQITNSERVNAEIELERGYNFHQLLQTEWGDRLEKEYPEFSSINDPAYFKLKDGDQVIAGFNTVVRNNPFMGDDAHKNVSLIASICQDGLEGLPSRIEQLISLYAGNEGVSHSQAAQKWFDKYLDLLLGNLTKIFSEFGLALEAHQQNTLLELSENGLPNHLYYRDNQGYFFREGKQEFVAQFLPELAEKEWTFVPEEIIFPKYTYYLIVNNVLGVLGAIARTGFETEDVLIGILRDQLNQLKEVDETGYVDYLLNSRDLVLKANMLTKLADMDEVLQPMDNPAVYKTMGNPLMLTHFIESYMRPKHTDYVAKRYFEDKDIQIDIRPFDIKRDLPTVHEWFNEEHTKTFWKMNGSIKNLEKFYIELEESEESTSYIGEVDGEASFTFEPYWSMRDQIGKYYEALPTDHGIHLLIAPTDKNKKFTFYLCRALMTHAFQNESIGKLIGEADVGMRPMHMLVTRIGFKFQRVLELPYKTANLTFCTRGTYLERFPDEQVYPAQLLEEV